ncbi:DUF192 domain-containing protein [Halococcus saccharolyticus]|uniref:DUF192 domain-containing protein n=1 Tax=Halococcus saccharolyticus DSM 5350 TaxID=1227455 RepID=M0MEH3_9EURY|nr:DUF192 domain-containing protein [Halococcus saccharolyticus]EMA44162.1 hypothetical protein C449_11568 [Halococcus saccharolyticus DSM 5350]
MALQRALNGIGVVAVLALVLTAAVAAGVVPPPAAFMGAPDDYERAEVTITNNCSQTLGTVDVRIADTYQQKYTGLSNTSSLANGSGMLFTYEESSEHTYVMREMDFPLDIVFIGADGRINAIESAPAPGPNENGENIQRTGRGQYILEVPRGWMASHGIHVGHRVDIDRSNRR